MKKVVYLITAGFAAVSIMFVVTQTKLNNTNASTGVSIIQPSSAIDIAEGASPIFEADITAPNGTVTCNWDMDGDGTYDDLLDSCGPVNYQFTSQGTFNVAVEATDLDNTQTSAPVAVIVDTPINTQFTVRHESTYHPERPYMTGSGDYFHPTNAPADPYDDGFYLGVSYGLLGGISPYECDWDLGTGFTGSPTSGMCNPFKIPYETEGTFSVNARVYDSSEVTPEHYEDAVAVTVIVDDMLSVTQTPSTTQTIDVGNSVTFEATPAGGIGSYTCNWDLDGDGTYDDELNNCGPFGHTFSASGIFNNIGVEVMDDITDYNSNQMTAQSAGVTINVNAMLNANMTPNTNQDLIEGESIDFEAVPSDGTLPYTCDWDMDGDGSFDDVPNNCDPTAYTFTSDGTYVVGVHITDANTNETTETITVNVSNPLSASITPSSDTTIIVGEAIDFSATPDGGIAPVTCDWDLDGDGSFDDAVGLCDPSAYTYSIVGGPFTVGVRVTDSDTPANTNQRTIDITVNNPLSATMTPDSNQTVYQGGSIDFSATPAGGIPPYHCNWDFDGDGLFDESIDNCNPDPEYFDTTGLFTNRGVEVSDSDSPANTVTRLIDVQVDPAPLTVVLTPDTNQEIGVGSAIDFNATPAGGVTPYTCNWDMDGDGSFDDVLANCNPTAHTYSSIEGPLTVGVQVTDDDAPQSTVIETIQVNVVAMSVSLVSPTEPQNIVANESVSFDATVIGGIAPLNYAWWFESATQSPTALPDSLLENPPMHQYTTTGTYYGCVRVTDSDSPANTDLICEQVNVNDIMAVTMPTTYEIYGGEQINFSAPTVTGGFSPYTYAWDFDGNSTTDSTSASPTSSAYAYRATPYVGTVTITDSEYHSVQRSFTVTTYNDITFAGIQSVAKIGDTNNVTVSWNAATGGKSPYLYKVYQRTTTGTFNFSGSTACLPTTLTSCTVTTLTSGNTYYFAVRAEDDLGTETTNTNEMSITIGNTGDLMPPTHIEAEADDGSIDLEWSGATGEVVAYDVFYAESSNSTLAEKETVSTTKATIDGLDNDKMYYIRIVSLDGSSNESDYSVEIKIKTLDDQEASHAWLDESGYWFQWIIEETALTGTFDFNDKDDDASDDLEVLFFDDQLTLTMDTDFLDSFSDDAGDEAVLFIEQTDVEDIASMYDPEEGFEFRGDYVYEITLTDDSDDEMTDFDDPMQIEFEFNDDDVMDSGNVDLYYWDEDNDEWVLEVTGSVSSSTVEMEPDHLTFFAVLEEVDENDDTETLTQDDLNGTTGTEEGIVNEDGTVTYTNDGGTTGSVASTEDGDTGSGSIDEGGKVLGDTTLTESGAGVLMLLFVLALIAAFIVKLPSSIRKHF